MTRLLAWLGVAISLCVAAAAGVSPGSISGYVKDSAGVAQMGAVVEVANGGQHLTAFTDTRGFFRVTGLAAGSYDVRVSAPSFLPALREDVAIAAGASKVVNITLNTLFEAIRMVPELKRSDDENNSWKWTLRSTANRPILRFEAGAPVVVESAQDHSTKGTLAFMAGGSNDGYGSAADLGTAFNVEHSIFQTSVIGLAGDLGYPGGGVPDGVVRATYRRRSDDGWTPSVAFTVRRFSAPDTVPHGGALQALSMFYSDGFSVADLLDIQIAGDASAVQFLGKEVNAFRPAGTADLHLTPDLILEYKYSTEEPNTRASKGFDTAPADLSENTPRMTMVDNLPLMENAHHHEVSLSQRFGNNKVQVAYFHDRIKDPALLGVGEIGISADDILPDVYSGTFSYDGGMLEAQGVRLVMQRRFSNGITATVDYAYGGVLDLDHPYVDWNGVSSSLEHGWRHTAALKLNGGLPHCKTRWIASYRWTSGDNTLTPVDLFNASAGQADPYFNLFLRQPLPHIHGMPLNMEAIIDLRNLLAQGYVPVIGPDGKTVYLMQSARSVRGGLAFSF
jgi:carboxypeptidase family protein